MREMNRYLIEVPYTVTTHDVARVSIEGTSEETAKCEAMAIVRAGLRQPIIHDAVVLATTPLEVISD